MESDIVTGLQLSAIGISLTFLALGLLILIISLLVKLFPESGASVPEDQDRVTSIPAETDEQRSEETAVAVAVAVAMLERENGKEYKDSSLGNLLER